MASNQIWSFVADIAESKAMVTIWPVAFTPTHLIVPPRDSRQAALPLD
jgi:hypothetical protein